MDHQAIGAAIRNAINTRRRKSFEIKKVIPVTDAPSTLRTPISLILVSAIYVARPNKPRQEINIVSPEKNAASTAVLFSS